MSRAFAAPVVLGLAAALALVPAPAPIAPDDARAAADCSWQRHSKRVVKRVKRQGRIQRVVRRKHWWTCDRGAAQSAAIPPSAPAAPAPAPPAAPEPPALGYLGVKAAEYSFTLSRPSVAAGEVIVELNNQGEDPHNLSLQREGDAGPPLEVDEVGSLEHRTGRFDLPVGTYRLWCSLPEHDELGMHANLVVVAG